MKGRVKTILPPLAWGAACLFLWEQFVNWRDIKPFLLPTPSRVWDRLLTNRTVIWEATKVTGFNAFVGLLVGALLALGVALVAQRFLIVRDLINPLSAAINTMPIVALGPIFYNMFGATSETARRCVVAMVAFFPIFVNVLKGLTQVEPVQEELMRSYAARPGQFLRLVRVPNALPFLLTGLRIAASLSVIAAVVVEYFGGIQNGLGSRTASAMKQTLTANAWAYITAACALGIAFYMAALLCERLAMPWHREREQAR